MWLRLSMLRGIGPVTGRRLVTACGSIKALWHSSRSELLAIEGIGPAAVDAICSARPDIIQPVIDLCSSHGITLISPDDPEWPESLSHIDDAPLILFLRGKADVLNGRMLAMVGARRASREGQVIARRWSRYLSDHDITVVSGMAFGIDAAAHRGAIEGRGNTVAVLGCGLAALNSEQQRQVDAIATRGCVISEYLPDQQARPDHFPRRNRIIAALTAATVVVEADLKSGSLITARFAADYGREVFAVPGSVLLGNHAGCHELISEGANLAEDAASLASMLGWNTVAGAQNDQQISYQPANAIEAKILEKVARESVHLDELVESCGLTLPELSPILLAFELKGVVERLPGGRYQKRTE